MRHLIVRRLTVGLGAGLVLVAAGFTWLVYDPAPPAELPTAAEPEGAALYAQYCGSCHPSEGPLRTALAAGGADTRARFETLLQTHGRAAPAEDRMILEYLAVP